MRIQRYTRTLITAALTTWSVHVAPAQAHRPLIGRGGDISGNGYCAPSFFNDGSAEHFIDGVVLGTISSANTGFTSDANGWNDRFFDGNGTVTWLEKGATFSVDVTTGTAGNSHYYGWVDQDRDQVFEATEYIGHFQGTGPGAQGTLSFTLPATVPTGYTGMRILCSSVLTANPDPCGGYAYGEAEDYAVLLAPATPCAPVHTEGTTQGDFISAVYMDAGQIGLPGAAGQFPYRPLQEVLHLQAGSAHELTVVSGEYGSDRYMAWVDWNADNDWDDAGELVGEVLASASNTGYIMDLNVPDTVWGWFPMRIRCADSGVLAPCNDETWGETRDHMVVVDHPLIPCLTHAITMPGAVQSINIGGSVVVPPTAGPHHWIRGLNPAVTIAPGSTLSILFNGNGANVSNLVVSYVDLNNDLDFNDLGETGPYMTGTAPFEVMNLSMEIPVGTAPGGHWVRVASYGQGFEFVTECQDPVAGGVLDTYIVVEDPDGPCMPGTVNWTSEGDFIDGVHLGDINNTGTGAQYGQVYSDHTDLTTDLVLTNSYDLTITAGAYATDEYFAWIDYNADNDFSDANEYLGSALGVDPFEQLVVPFIVPDGIALGEKRMRVRCLWNAGPDPCADGNFGETEDYTVDIGSNTEVVHNAEPGWSAQVVNGGEGVVVSITDDALKGASIQVLDARGRIVWSSIASGISVTTMPAGNLCAGVYTLRLEVRGVAHMCKLMLSGL